MQLAKSSNYSGRWENRISERNTMWAALGSLKDWRLRAVLECWLSWGVTAKGLPGMQKVVSSVLARIKPSMVVAHLQS